MKKERRLKSGWNQVQIASKKDTDATLKIIDIIRKPLMKGLIDHPSTRGLIIDFSSKIRCFPPRSLFSAVERFVSLWGECEGFLQWS